jgi:hypothetical protein
MSAHKFVLAAGSGYFNRKFQEVAEYMVRHPCHAL